MVYVQVQVVRRLARQRGVTLQNQSRQATSNKSVASEVNIEAALLANIFLPGLGSWRLGARKRGALIMAVMIFSVLYGGSLNEFFA